MKVYKDCDGVKIDKCKDCNYIYKPIKSYACGKVQVQIKDIGTIPDWCLLRNWNEVKRMLAIGILLMANSVLWALSMIYKTNSFVPGMILILSIMVLMSAVMMNN